MSVALMTTPREAACWLRSRKALHVVADSRLAGPETAFLAFPGASHDGRDFVDVALRRGASACLLEAEGRGERKPLPTGNAVACYAGLKRDAGPIASHFYQQPSCDLKVAAVTGTNGKTSVSWFLAAALGRLGRADLAPAAVVGTLGAGLPGQLLQTGFTTPDAVSLQSLFHEFVGADVQSCALEASSIGLAEHRLDGTAVDLAIFTNLTQDHLDYHGSMRAYGQAKARLFSWPGLQAAIVNIDDAFGRELAGQLSARELALWTVSLEDEGARLLAADIGQGDRGLCWHVCEGRVRLPFASRFVGRHNISNLLQVVAALRAWGVSLEDALAACVDLPPVPGRLECLESPGKPMVWVDFAHTPDALGQALQALQGLTRHRRGKLWCVFGCGGHRDRGKRPLMGAVAEVTSDRLVVTSDNPRDEEPMAIIADILAGLRRREDALIQVDRAQAISDAVSAAAPEDVILVAGKGHERYQELAGQRLPFSDQAIVRDLLGLPPETGVRGVAA